LNQFSASFALTTLGCAVWASRLVAAGMLLGASWQHAGDALRIPLVLAAVAACIGILLAARRKKP
jgi:membrane protein DedA with SNARE-associated domain